MDCLYGSTGYYGKKMLLLKTVTNKRYLMKVQLVENTYPKVASSRPVYYSSFDHFGGATNQDVLPQCSGLSTLTKCHCEAMGLHQLA